MKDYHLPLHSQSFFQELGWPKDGFFPNPPSGRVNMGRVETEMCNEPYVNGKNLLSPDLPFPITDLRLILAEKPQQKPGTTGAMTDTDRKRQDMMIRAGQCT